VTNVAGSVTYTATAGEANRLVLDRQPDALLITDTGAAFLFALPGCSSAGPRSIRCEGVTSAEVTLGDGDDVVSVIGELRLRADGGPGDDRLTGGRGADVLDGGSGKDTVDYASRAGPVVVTLDGASDDGEPGELDLVVRVEVVVGGLGGDVIEGDDGPNEIHGGPGDDSLGGGGGADVLDGGDGQDGVNALDPPRGDGAGGDGDGGPGDGAGGDGAGGSGGTDPGGPGAGGSDSTGTGPGGDRVACGDGRDRVFGDDADGVEGDCEKVSRGAVAGISVGSRVGPGAPPPVLGRSVLLEPVSGVVLVTSPEPGSSPRQRQDVPASPAVPLTDETNVPVGAVVDTRFGTVDLTVAVDRAAATETGRFHSGPFQVFQDDVVGTDTDIELRGGKSFADCPAGQKGPGVARASKHRKIVRRLWAQTKGRFRTRGRYATATVRGTRWMTADRCDGTLVTVREGAVAVRDLARGQTVRVRAGQSKLIRGR